MSYDPGLAERIREVVSGQPGIDERAMFGGLAFLVDGKMFVGIIGGTLMARVGVERHQDALALPHVRPMDFTGRPMKGYVYVDPPALAEDAELGKWVNWCLAHVRSLPAKAPRRR